MARRAQGRGQRKPNQTQLLVALAHRRYAVRLATTGQAFAVAKEGPRIALPIQRGGVFSKQLTREFYDQYETVPTPNALSGALSVLEAEAMDQERVTVYLRCAKTSTGLVLDLGDETASVVVVENGKWRKSAAPPRGIVFRRTSLTATLPDPGRRGDLDSLRSLIPVSDEGWDLIRAWMVLAWMPHIPVPILSITGPQGSGKSMLARTLVGIVDPSSAPVRSAPRDLGDWQTTAAASRVVALDNMSHIPEWFSDALCRAVSGEGSAKRALYTDESIIVQHFHRAVVLTSIDPGSLRGDLGERLMPLELPPFRRGRRTEQSLRAELHRLLPTIVGGLLDLVAQVDANPVALKRPPRMADAAQVMAAMDHTLGSSALTVYSRSQSHVVAIVLESDPLAAAILAFMKGRSSKWSGTPTELFDALEASSRYAGGKNWPANARTLSQRLARMAPALEDAHELRVVRTRGARRLIQLRWLGDDRHRSRTTLNVKF